MNYVLYHKNCLDGLGAAAAVALGWGDGPGWAENKDFPKFIPIQYGDPIPQEVLENGETVYLVDFSFKKGGMTRLVEAVKEKVVVIDHHKTAIEELDDEVFKRAMGEKLVLVLDVEHSGAVLTWRYLYPDEPVPPLLKHLEDRDLWKWELEGSREITTGLMWVLQEDEPVEAMVGLIGGSAEELGELWVAGESVLRHVKGCVKRVVENAKLREFDGELVPFVNETEYVSEVCNELLEQYPEAKFAVAYRDVGDLRVYGLRSRNGGYDVGELARKYGGGGHHSASGFTRVLIGGVDDAR